MTLLLSIRRHQIFIFGGGDENEKVLGKFLARKKGAPKFFACGGLFFVVEALKTVKKPLKPLKNVNFFPKTVKFFKKGTPKIFRLRRAFFQKSPRSILRKSSVKVGGVKNILHPPPYDGVWDSCRSGSSQTKTAYGLVHP